MTTTFIQILRAVARVLAKFAEPNVSGSLTWNGSAYVPTSGSKFDPYAAKWWSVITTIAELFDGHQGKISDRQKAYLDRLLFGGMGSFNDFELDEHRLGPEARHTNQELSRLRKELFEQFSRM